MTVKERKAGAGNAFAASRAKQPDDLAANGGGCDQTSLRAALVKAKDHAQRIGNPRNIG
jgi:hypothetical protein